MAKTLKHLPAGLQQAFSEHRAALHRYLRRRLGNEEDARELAQESFLRLLRVNRADLIADPQAYLYRIARNLIYEQSAKRLPAHQWADDEELQALADPHDTPEREVERTALSQRLQQVIAELQPRTQTILLLFCQQGLSQREIAEQLGLSKSMVQKCLAQGFALCRKRLGSSIDKGVLR